VHAARALAPRCPMTVLLGLPRVDANSDSGGLVAYFYGGMCLHPYKAPAIGQLRGVNRTKAVAAAEGIRGACGLKGGAGCLHGSSAMRCRCHATQS
jgi:hypothetical protein